MKAECPMGHEENLSFEELLQRLIDNDFECRHEECNKQYSYEVDQQFWEKYLAPYLAGEARENIDTLDYPERMRTFGELDGYEGP